MYVYTLYYFLPFAVPVLDKSIVDRTFLFCFFIYGTILTTSNTFNVNIFDKGWTINYGDWTVNHQALSFYYSVMDVDSVIDDGLTLLNDEYHKIRLFVNKLFILNIYFWICNAILANTFLIIFLSSCSIIIK